MSPAEDDSFTNHLILITVLVENKRLLIPVVVSLCHFCPVLRKKRRSGT